MVKSTYLCCLGEGGMWPGAIGRRYDTCGSCQNYFILVDGLIHDYSHH